MLFSYFFVHSTGIVLPDIIRYLYDLHRNGSCAHCNFDAIADLDIITGFDHTAIHTDAAVVAGFICYRPTLDQTGYFQILVKTHKGELLGDSVLQSLAGLESG